MKLVIFFTVIFLLFALLSVTCFLNLAELVLHREKYIKENNTAIFVIRCLVSFIYGIAAALPAFYIFILLITYVFRFELGIGI